MGNKLKINTDDSSLRDLLGNGKKYIVPKFQRDYSWERDQWEDLWEDLTFINDNTDEYHYMGYLVLQENKEDSFLIIDGQQRFATFSLIILAAIKRLKFINDEERSSLLFDTFIGSKDLTNLQVVNKLTLNRNNNYDYKQAVSDNEIQGRGAKKTVRLMSDALGYFCKKFDNFTDGEKISQMIENIAKKILFTTIFIGDELNAYKVFETLNARGVKLSSADLLKNYLFSTIDIEKDMPDNLIDNLDEKWEKIGSNIAGKNYTDYIFTEWNSWHKKVRQQQLFNNIKKEITTQNEANTYLNKLSTNCYIYAALSNYEDEFWKDLPNYIDIKNDLKFLKLFGISQPMSLLLTSYLNFKDDFHTILRWIKNLSFRYNVICRGHTGEQENLYSEICMLIKKNCTIVDIKNKLLSIYPDDNFFISNFTNKSFPTKRSNKKARYILARLADNGDNSIDESKLTVEHILPEEPENLWIEYFGDNYDLFNQRVGNMALVDKDTNAVLAQKTFTEKKEILMNIDYTIHKSIKEYSDWGSEEITSRQSELAKIASNIWVIS